MVSYILEHPVLYKVINNNLLLNKKYNNVFKKNNIPNARHIHTDIISCIFAKYRRYPKYVQLSFRTLKNINENH